MAQVRYFAAAKEAAGAAVEQRPEATVGELRSALVKQHPRLGRVLPSCAVLVHGQRAVDETPLDVETVVDILPPFAGG